MSENDNHLRLVNEAVIPRTGTGVLLELRATGALARRRDVIIVDDRLPMGRARLLAWNVVPQGRQDLSTWLCRGATGHYFVLCRSGNRAELLPAIVPLSPARAAAWFARHPRHMTDWDHVDELTVVSGNEFNAK